MEKGTGAAFFEKRTGGYVTGARRMAGVSVAWIVPFFLGAAMFPGPALAETVRISGTGGAIGGMRLLAEAFRKAEPGVDVFILPSLGSSGGIRAVLAGKFVRFVRSPGGKAILSRVGHVLLP
jgi:ABC-type phosphate transport system substrate-binding protein